MLFIFPILLPQLPSIKFFPDNFLPLLFLSLHKFFFLYHEILFNGVKERIGCGLPNEGAVAESHSQFNVVPFKRTENVTMDKERVGGVEIS